MLALKLRPSITSAGNTIEDAKRSNTYPKKLHIDLRD